MIVVDSSAIIAILFDEPEKQAFQNTIDGEERCFISAVNAHETACILRGRLGVDAVIEFWRWLAENNIEIVPFDEVQVHAAAAAFHRYGEGIDPRARLNLSDCAALALARTVGAPLLFKGNDFEATDVARAHP